MNSLPLVIYHANCWDGFCAAWVARKALGDIDAVPANYGQPPPDVRGRDEVYLLDFSYPRAVMRDLVVAMNGAGTMVILDHHKTAEADLAGFDEAFAPDVTVWFDMDKSGGRLAWQYFAPRISGQVLDTPWLVDYTEDRDLWRHKLEDSEAINAALRSYPLDFDLWDRFERQHPTDFTREGEAIRRREKQIVTDHARNAVRRMLCGHSVPVVNATVMFSEIAGELGKGEPFAACYFDRKDGKRQWSLRSDDNGLDVSLLAKERGGGGHKHAAGFEEII